MKQILLLGCGSNKKKQIWIEGESPDWGGNVLTLDNVSSHAPDVVWDLEKEPDLPFQRDFFDEIHAYEVLEHIGMQGDYELFFKQFTSYWRVLKPGGRIYATTPLWNSLWAWGDPSHKRIINRGSLVFLSQQSYEDQVGKTAMSDFRGIYKADFKIVHQEDRGEHFIFILEAVKPPPLKFKSTKELLEELGVGYSSNPAVISMDFETSLFKPPTPEAV